MGRTTLMSMDVVAVYHIWNPRRVPDLLGTPAAKPPTFRCSATRCSAPRDFAGPEALFQAVEFALVQTGGEREQGHVGGAGHQGGLLDGVGHDRGPGHHAT